jgi:hypothetical protein
MKIFFFLLCVLALSSNLQAQYYDYYPSSRSQYDGQARLHFVNQSSRQMEVKVMEEGDGLYITFTVEPWGRHTCYFPQTGQYYLKTKASLAGRDPLYKKGDYFRVYVGNDGYSEITVTYSITESNINISSGKTISKSEFDRNDK